MFTATTQKVANNIIRIWKLLQTNIIVVKREAANIKALENCMLFAIKGKLQKEETSNCPQHSSSNRKSDHNRIPTPSAS